MPISPLTALAAAVAVPAVLLLLTAIVHPLPFRIGVRNARRDRVQGFAAMAGAMVGTAAVTGAFLIGDSMDALVEEQVEANLGEMDAAVTAPRFFSTDLYDEAGGDARVSALADRSAPLAVLPAAAFNDEAGRSQLKSRLVGYDNRYLAFGDLLLEDGYGNNQVPYLDAGPGDPFRGKLEPGHAVLNKALADELDITVGDKVRVLAADPSFDLTSVFSLEDQGKIELTFTAAGVVKDEELGRYQLDGRADVTPTLFADLQDLQDGLDVDGLINTMVFSAEGGTWDGAEGSAELVEALEEALDDAAGVDESKYRVEPVNPDHWEARIPVGEVPQWITDRVGALDPPDYRSVPSQVRVTSEDFFFRGDDLVNALELEGISGSPVLTYLVNSISSPDDGGLVSYSTVAGIKFEADAGLGELTSASTLEPIEHNIGDDEVVLSTWTSGLLNVSVGDTVMVNYTIIDEFLQEREFQASFVVADIVSMTGKALDRSLMPHFPGIEGIEDCSRFEPPFDVDLSTVTDADERYWDLYEGAPKAFFSLNAARAMWSNAEGDTTSIRVLAEPATTGDHGLYDTAVIDAVLEEVTGVLDEYIGAGDASMAVVDLKGQAEESAGALELFPQMFAAFGSVVVLVGILFTVTAVGNLAAARRRETGVMRALGMRSGRVAGAFFSEGLLYSTVGSALGVLVGLAIGWALVGGLNGAFQGAVEGQSIPFAYSPASLSFGFLAGFLIAAISAAIAAGTVSRGNVVSALGGKWRYGGERAVKRGKGKRAKSDARKGGAEALEELERGDRGEAPEGEGAGDLVGGVPVRSSRSGGNPAFRLPAIFMLLVGILLLAFPALVYAGALPSYKRMGLGDPGTLFYLWGVALFIIGLLFAAEWRRGPLPPKVRAAGGISVGVWVTAFALIPPAGGNAPLVGLFISVGFLLLFSVLGTLLMGRGGVSARVSRGGGGKWALPVRLAMANPGRHAWRSASTTLTFGVTMFLIMSLAMAGAAVQEEAREAAHIGGGYDIMGETAVPYDMDLADIRVDGVDGLKVTAVRSVGSEGGTCSNMNAKYPPRLLGVGEDFRSETAVKVRRSADGDALDREVWESLYEGGTSVGTGGASEAAAEFPDGPIPIAVDYNTLVWIYGGGLGTIFTITDEMGMERDLEVSAVLENSIFAGTFVMAREYLELLFPASAGYTVFLFTAKTDAHEAAPLIERALADYGMDAAPIVDIIESNVQYERSFMDLFGLYLGFGLILGGAGLCISMDRAVTERRYEIGVKRSLGFTRGMVMSEVILEAGILIGAGIIMGTLVAYIASLLTFGMWGPGGAVLGIDLGSRGMYVLVLYLLGILAVLPAAWRAARLEPAEAMRTGE